MRNPHAGDLIVAEPKGASRVPVGIVTDRDLVVKVLAEGVAPVSLTAADLMRCTLVTAVDADPVHEAIVRICTEDIRCLPVVDGSGALVGMLSADDVTEFIAEELNELARIGPRQLALERAALPQVAQ
jgi:CBS domain-containing protein